MHFYQTNRLEYTYYQQFTGTESIFLFFFLLSGMFLENIGLGELQEAGNWRTVQSLLPGLGLSVIPAGKRVNPSMEPGMNPCWNDGLG